MATHTLLRVSEFEGQFTQDTPPNVELVNPSPWTGAILPLSNLVEACFVWYGLYHFWLLAQAGTQYPEEVINSHLGRCSRGFQKYDIVKSMGDQGRFLDPRCVKMI